jgi:pyrroloquinoline quinone (PQQ) biosynthesis protein C
MGVTAMSTFELVWSRWSKSMAALSQRPHMQMLANKTLAKKHYMAYLRETYFHAGLNPQIQAVATIYFKDNPRDLIKKFYQHAISEIGHDLLALNDLAAMGVDVSKIPMQRPLPFTSALNAFPLFEMQFRNPMAYLGYLFHLEFMPTQNGQNYMTALREIGVPDGAMTFIEEHATVDVQHNKFMEFYLSRAVKTQEDLEAVIYGAVATCELHGQMIAGAFEAADRGELTFEFVAQNIA